MDLTITALKLAEETKDIYAGVLNTDIGNILMEQNRPRQALRYQKKSSSIKESLGQQGGNCPDAQLYRRQLYVFSKPDSALHFLPESEKIRLSLNDHAGHRHYL